MRTTSSGRGRATTTLVVVLLAGLLQTVGAGVAAAASFDIRSFGATANDGTDDTVAIQAAINAARWGGTVTIPSGVFLVSPQSSSAALMLRSGVTMSGAGPSSVLKVVDGNGRTVRVISTHSGDPQPPRNVALRDFAVDGNRGTSTQSPSHEQDHGVYMTDSSGLPPSNILIENLTVTGMQGDGILVRSGEQISLRNNRVLNNFRAGLNLEGANHSVASGNLASENKSGIHVEMNPGAVNQGLVIANNTLVNNNCGICLNGDEGRLEDVTVSDNLIVGPTDPARIGDGTQLGTTIKYGIGLANLSGGRVAGNVLREWTEEGAIKVRWGVRDTVIEHNTVIGTRGPTGSARGMIRVGGSTNATPNSNIMVRNNLLHRTRGGLYVTTNAGGRSSDITFEANVVDDLLAGQPIRVRDAAGTVRIASNTITHALGWSGSYLINLNAEAGAGGLDNVIIAGNHLEQNSGKANINVDPGIRNLTVSNNHRYGATGEFVLGRNNVSGQLSTTNNLWQAGPPLFPDSGAGPVTSVLPFAGERVSVEGSLSGFPPGSLMAVDEGARWHVLGATPSSFYFGIPRDVPLLGDWDCNGSLTPGMYRPNSGFVYLRNSTTTGFADIDFYLGLAGDLPLAGDWNGDGCDTVGVFRPGEAKVYLRNSLTTGFADIEYYLGLTTDQPVAGDFDGNGSDEVGVYRSSLGSVHLRYGHSAAPADHHFSFGRTGDVLLAGDWNSSGTDGPAVFRPATGEILLRNANSAGDPLIRFDLGTGQLRIVS